MVRGGLARARQVRRLLRTVGGELGLGELRRWLGKGHQAAAAAAGAAAAAAMARLCEAKVDMAAVVVVVVAAAAA